MHFLPPPDIRERAVVGSIDQGYRYLLMPFALSVGTSGHFGDIVTQVYQAEDFNVFQHHFFIREGTFLYAVTDRPTLTINYMLLGSPVANLKEAGKLVLKEQTYQFFYVPPLPQEVWFEPGEYHCLHIEFKTEYLLDLAASHSRLRQAVIAALKNSDIIIPHSNGKINSRIRTTLERMMAGSSDKGEMAIHTKRLVMELLLHYIRRHHAITPAEIKILKSERDRIDAIVSFINDNLDSLLSIDQLALQFGYSRTDLCKKFKNEFNVPISTFVRDARLDKAMEMILQNKYPINLIAVLVGYENNSSFTRSFRHKFGHPPSFFSNSDGE